MQSTPPRVTAQPKENMKQPKKVLLKPVEQPESATRIRVEDAIPAIRGGDSSASAADAKLTLPAPANYDPSRYGNRSWTLQPLEAVDEANPPVRSIRAEDLVTVYQPLVDVASTRVIGYEVAIRSKWEAYRTPELLFAQAEKQHALGSLGRVAREAAFASAPRGLLFMPIHPGELTTRWPVRPDDPLYMFDRPLHLELSGEAILDQYDLVRGALAEIRSRSGAQIVINDLMLVKDDLRRVMDLHPAYVKLSAELVRGALPGSAQETAIRSLVRIAKDFGAGTIAQGLLHVDELRTVADAGVQYAQGDLFAEPAYPPPASTWPPDAKAGGYKD